ncbi:DUF1330 domain-containing protein [Sphingobium sp.]|uniref:DUF1330 domain-containing protein n=1 Tax=Sphingobium sp. TaxID=1912891 RepID=UPI0035C71395
MSRAFILTTVTVTNPQAFAAYRAAIAGLNERIGGDMLIRGRTIELLEGDGETGEVIIVIGFPDAGAARAYITSPEYQAARPLREAAGRFRIRLVA